MGVKLPKRDSSNLSRTPSPTSSKKPASNAASSKGARPETDSAATRDTVASRVKEPWNPSKFVQLYDRSAHAAQLPTFRGDAARLEYIGRSLYPDSRTPSLAEFAEQMRDYDLMDI